MGLRQRLWTQQPAIVIRKHAMTASANIGNRSMRSFNELRYNFQRHLLFFILYFYLCMVVLSVGFNDLSHFGYYHRQTITHTLSNCFLTFYCLDDCLKKVKYHGMSSLNGKRYYVSSFLFFSYFFAEK